MTSPAAWVYLSPHLDDAVLSCGGLIAAQVRLGHPVLILTVCAGDPPAGELTPLARVLHERWQTGLQTAAVRRAEDLAACARLGAAARHLDLPDCIYRRSPKTGFPVISANEDLFAPIHPDEIPLVAALAERLRGRAAGRSDQRGQPALTGRAYGPPPGARRGGAAEPPAVVLCRTSLMQPTPPQAESRIPQGFTLRGREFAASK